MIFLNALPLWKFEFLDSKVFAFTGMPVTVATLVAFVLIVVLALVASKAIRAALAHALHRRGVAAEEGGLAATLRLVHYAILAIGVGIALETLGVDLAALFAAGIVFAIAIGFAMQNIVQNFLSGLVLLFERSIKPGDVIQVGDLIAKVERMGLRTTMVRTLDDEETIVPNNILAQSLVANYAMRDSLYRVRTRVGVAYGSDMQKVREVLEAAAASLTWRVERRPPLVLMAEFAPAAVEFEVSIWMSDPWRMRRARSDLNEAIWDALNKAGISIAARA
ncbi:MAG: mechanosensitive ion channel [Candidatus Eisenbacteria bacterium]|nr:mechanosensitive ion channel [Candidatus Eisenbacteria bacterium]